MIDPKEFSRQLHEDRMKMFEATRPKDPRAGETGTGFKTYERERAERDARMAEHRRNQARDFLTRRDGRPPAEDVLDVFLGLTDSNGAS